MGKVSKKMMNGYNVALHGIRASNGSKEIAESIMENGLIMRAGTNSIRCTTIQFGDEYRNENFKEELAYNLENYQFGADSEGYTVIVATPTVLRNSAGEMLFLGDPYRNKNDQNVRTSGQEYETTCILDMVCANLGRIPPEFILGYENKDGEIVNNPNHYSKQVDKEKIDELYTKVKESLSPFELDISQKIANGEFESLENRKRLLAIYGMDEILNIIQSAEEQYSEVGNDEVEF